MTPVSRRALLAFAAVTPVALDDFKNAGSHRGIVWSRQSGRYRHAELSRNVHQLPPGAVVQRHAVRPPSLPRAPFRVARQCDLGINPRSSLHPIFHVIFLNSNAPNRAMVSIRYCAGLSSRWQAEKGYITLQGAASCQSPNNSKATAWKLPFLVPSASGRRYGTRKILFVYGSFTSVPGGNPRTST